MTTVVALGGNALARRGEPIDIDVQRRNVERAAASVAFIARHDSVLLTHGNGPQVGLLALQNEAFHDVAPYPLDVLGAESEGMIGYLLEQELSRAHCPRPVTTLLTQVVVALGDPAFAHPTKPIGPVYGHADGPHLARERGWTLAPDGSGLRRVVASPEPIGIVELEVIRLLLAADVLVIAAGGGGIPVVALPGGGYRGVEAVIDKDRTAALLATELQAHTLLLLTDVDAVYDAFGTPHATALRRIGVDELRRLELPTGSMGPKAEAACRFVESGGRALIGCLDDVAGLLAGETGTEVARDGRTITAC